MKKEFKKIQIHLFEQYQKIQDKLLLKIPYCNHFKIAKIFKINEINQGDSIKIDYYYDGLNGEQVKIIMKESEGKLEGFIKDFKLELQDVLMAKQVLQCLIESFHWTANFGQFLDPFRENLIFHQEQDFFLLIPTFTVITKYIFYNKFEFSWEKFVNYRLNVYQNVTHIFFCEFLDTFYPYVKELDEDKKFYKQQFYAFQLKRQNIDELFELKEKYAGVDSLYSEDLIKKKSWRYSFKQSMILYQLDSNEELRKLFLDKKKIDQELSKNGKQQPNIKTQTENLLEFLRALPDIRSESHDVLTSFAQKIKQYLDSKEEFKQLKNNVAAVFRPNYKHVVNNNKMIDFAKQQQQEKQKIDKQKIDIEQNNGYFDFVWQSDINSLNIISQYIQSSFNRNGGDNQCSMKLGAEGKQLILKYKFELLEQKNCYIVRTVIPEIMFTIETADDIMFLVNVIQKEQGQTNLYVDDNRRLMLYSSIVMGYKIEILSAIVKIIDIHQIYFYLILEFYAKNIAVGRSVRELKYQHFVRELLHYVQDYENDFENQMKNIMSDNVQIGF
ncbi:unnamed protein product [Paramecium pentaurelia]|uniref:Uncharacterized protein n=1 Tax=Paramecium pentaurelia TaxID=43138 RepID=A0A8S1Y1E1_9CILI|nr:unnamed protein product [Paramecium pentaurelia]